MKAGYANRTVAIQWTERVIGEDMSTPPRKSILQSPVVLLLVVAALGAFAFTIFSPPPSYHRLGQPYLRSSLLVSRADFGADWPLTVESGVLSCIAPTRLVFEANQQRYAVNGTALGLPGIDSIWADEPSVAGVKKSIRPLIDTKVCEDH